MDGKFTVQQLLAEMKLRHSEYKQLHSSNDHEMGHRLSFEESFSPAIKENYQPAMDNQSPEKPKPKRKFLRKGQGKLACAFPKSLLSQSKINVTENGKKKDDSPNLRKGIGVPVSKKTFTNFTSGCGNKSASNDVCLDSNLSPNGVSVNYQEVDAINEKSSMNSLLEVSPVQTRLNVKVSGDRKGRRGNGVNPNNDQNSYSTSSNEEDVPNWVGENSLELSLMNKIKIAEQKTLKEAKELELFELLEKKMNDTSFCSSSSSLITRLMEPSVKSTPKKQILNTSSSLINNKYDDLENNKNFICDCPQYKCIDEKDCESSMSDCSEESNSYKIVSTHPINTFPDKKVDSCSINFDDKFCWGESESSCHSNYLETSNLHNIPDTVLKLNTSNSEKSSEVLQETILTCFDDQNVNLKKLEIQNTALELAQQVEKLKKELQQLLSKKNKYVSEMKNFDKERQKALKNFMEEKKQFEIFQQEERKKLSKEKATLERHSKLLRDQPKFNQQASEIKLLKEELSKLQAEMKDKQKSYGVVLSSLRVQVHTLLEKNQQLTIDNELLTKKLHSFKNQNNSGNKTKKITFLKKSKSTSTFEDIASRVDNVTVPSLVLPLRLDIKGNDDIKKSLVSNPSLLPHNQPSPGSEICYDPIVLRAESEDSYDSSTSDFRDEFYSPSLPADYFHYQQNKQPVKDLLHSYPSNDVYQNVDLIESCPIRQMATENVDKKFLDGLIVTSYPDQREQLAYTTGEVIYRCFNNAVILYPNGEVEITDGQLAVHYFHDGSFKTVHSDGSTETVYANNRIRIRNQKGQLILDQLLSCK